MIKKSMMHWRSLNLLFLLTTLFLPWEVVCSDVIMVEMSCFNIPGWKTILFSLQVMIEDPELLTYIQGTLINIGELCLVIYIIANCLLFEIHNHSLINRLKRLLLITAILSTFILLLSFERMGMIGLTWGYWLTCIVLFSSLLLEILETRRLQPNRTLLKQNI